MNKAARADLLRRVEAGTGPDLEIDHLIHDALIEPIGTRVYNPADYGGAFICADVWAPPYTASIDAALALVERMLPDWGGEFTLTNVGTKGKRCAIWCGNDDADGQYRVGATYPLAILAALLKALPDDAPVVRE